jgi:hypothetical protein
MALHASSGSDLLNARHLRAAHGAGRLLALSSLLSHPPHCTQNMERVTARERHRRVLGHRVVATHGTVNVFFICLLIANQKNKAKNQKNDNIA